VGDVGGGGIVVFRIAEKKGRDLRHWPQKLCLMRLGKGRITQGLAKLKLKRRERMGGKIWLILSAK